MGLSHEHIGSKEWAKIKIYMLTRAELLFTLWKEIPCISHLVVFANTLKSVEISKQVLKWILLLIEGIREGVFFMRLWRHCKKLQNKNSVADGTIRLALYWGKFPKIAIFIWAVDYYELQWSPCNSNLVMISSLALKCQSHTIYQIIVGKLTFHRFSLQ